jgi:hypothetical protein
MEFRLGQGTKKPEAGRQAKEAKVTLFYSKRVIGLLIEI